MADEALAPTSVDEIRKDRERKGLLQITTVSFEGITLEQAQRMAEYSGGEAFESWDDANFRQEHPLISNEDQTYKPFYRFGIKWGPTHWRSGVSYPDLQMSNLQDHKFAEIKSFNRPTPIYLTDAISALVAGKIAIVLPLIEEPTTKEDLATSKVQTQSLVDKITIRKGMFVRSTIDSELEDPRFVDLARKALERRRERVAEETSAKNED